MHAILFCFVGLKDACDYFVCQAQFDAENFVNEEIQLSEDISRRYVSLRDYDMQVVDVSCFTNAREFF